MQPQPRDTTVTVASRRSVYEDAGRATAWGLGVNLFLVVLKFAGGLLTGSVALIADAVNSVGDVANAIAVHWALKIAQRDEDEDHPYGHTKAESIAGLSVTLIIAFSAGMLAFETFSQLGGTHRSVGASAGVVAAICMIIKEITYRYSNHVANTLRSTSLQAAALDHRSDAIGSGVVAIALLVSPIFGNKAVYVDPIAAIFVCGYLIFMGVRMFAKIAAELMDQQADQETVALVRDIASSVAAVADVEKLRVRKSGLEYFAEIHIQVEGHLTVSEGHRIGHAVKHELMAKIPRLRDVHVHIEPYGQDVCEATPRRRDTLPS